MQVMLIPYSHQLTTSEMEFFIVGTTTYLFPSSVGKFNELTSEGGKDGIL